MAKEREIRVSTTSINAALKKQNVYGTTETGSRHIITGNVTREKDGLYADTYVGRRKIVKANVIDQ